jgi:hypothetical protein
MTDIRKWFEDASGITTLKQQVASYKDLASKYANERNEWNAKWASAWQQYQVTLKQLEQVAKDLQAMKELDQKDQDIITAIQKQNEALIAQLKSITATSLFKKLNPVLLKEVPSTHVMLGGFTLKTSLGQPKLYYPDRPSIFFPCPYYEHILDQAGVNAARPLADGGKAILTPLEICKKISNVCQNRIKYKKDSDQWFGYLDNWEIAPLGDMIGLMDCESSSINIISAILYWELKYGAFNDYSVFLGLGHYNGYGHGFVLILHNTSTNLKDSWIIESTVEFDIPLLNLEEHTKIYTCDWGIIGFVRESYQDGTYEIDGKYQWWKSTAAEVGNMKISKDDKVKVGILDRVQVAVGLKPDKDKEKKDAIDKYFKKFRR